MFNELVFHMKPQDGFPIGAEVWIAPMDHDHLCLLDDVRARVIGHCSRVQASATEFDTGIQQNDRIYSQYGQDVELLESIFSWPVGEVLHSPLDRIRPGDLPRVLREGSRYLEQMGVIRARA